MKTMLIIVVALVLSACSILATQITMSQHAIPEQYHGYYSPVNPGHLNVFRDYYRIDNENIYVKNITFDFNTGQPYSQYGHIYSIYKIITHSETAFEAILLNTIEDKDCLFAFAIYNENNQVKLLPATAMPDDEECFKHIINKKDVLSSIVEKSLSTPIIQPIPPVNFPPDTDTRPFITKVTSSTGKGYDFWTVAPLVAQLPGAELILNLMNMSVGSHVVFFNQTIKTNGKNYINVHSPYPVYGYAYKDKDWIKPNGWRNPYFVLHYEPGPADRFGAVWAKTPIGAGVVPLMIYNDIAFSGLLTIVNPNNIKEAVKNIKWTEIFDQELPELMKYHHTFTRASLPEVDLSKQMPYLPATTIVSDPLKN